MTEAQTEMEAISTDAPALQRNKEGVERGADLELLAERSPTIPSTLECPAHVSRVPPR